MAKVERDPRLQSRLQSLDEQLAVETQHLVSTAEPNLWHSLATFPSGTSHTPEHTSSVELIASMLMPDELLAELNADELQLLILGCHYHDLGMAGTEADNTDAVTQEQARRDHAIRVGERIKENWQTLGFRDTKLAEVLAEVCRWHRPPKVDGFATWDSAEQVVVMRPGRQVRLRLVSAIVYAADELHIGADRATEREEEWLQPSGESRKHWRRHQQIDGPDVVGDALRFEVKVRTLGLERDLRKAVLSKALSGVEASRRALSHEGLAPTLRTIEVVWKREELWRLLLVKQWADNQARSLEMISREVVTSFSEESAAFESISDFAVELQDSEDDCVAGVRRVADDCVRSNHVLADDGSAGGPFKLSTDLASSRTFFRGAEEADKLDAVFAGQHAAQHEFQLQGSPYGSLHHEKHVVPKVLSAYGVNASVNGGDKAESTLLARSPTARRMAVEGAPPPGGLSKATPLSLALVAGAAVDMMRDPSLMLDKDVRAAFKGILERLRETTPVMTRLLEELALVDGFTHDQVAEAVVPSEAAQAAYLEATDDAPDAVPRDQQPHFVQEIPLGQPAVSYSIGHIKLVGQRADCRVDIMASEATPLSVTGVNGEEAEKELASISFSPSTERLSKIALRADFEYDSDARKIRIKLLDIGDGLDIDAPLHVATNWQWLSHQGGGEKAQVNMHFIFNEPALRIRHVVAQEAIGALPSDAEVEAAIMAPDSTPSPSGPIVLSGEQLEGWRIQLIKTRFTKFLHEKGPDLYAPVHCPSEVIDAVKSGDEEEFNRIYSKYSTMPVERKMKTTSITVRIATQGGIDYREDVYGLVPNVTLQPPTFTFDGDAATTQDEVNEAWWGSQTDSVISWHFTEGEFELANEFEQWLDDTTKPFPMQPNPGAPRSPVVKSHCDIIHKPLVDRLWFAERPLIIRLRPCTEAERLNVEGLYWQSKQDVAREQLVGERLAELRAIEGEECMPK